LKRQPQLVDHPTPEPNYTSAITLRLLRELSERGPLTFQDLVRAAEGAYPSDVLFSLHSLEKDGQISRLTFDRWTKGDAASRENAQAPPAPMSSSPVQIDALPEPHPIDFDWRFTDATLSDLEGYIHASSAERVAVLGAPTLFQRLSRSGVSVHLFDKNPQIVISWPSETRLSANATSLSSLVFLSGFSGPLLIHLGISNTTTHLSRRAVNFWKWKENCS